MNGYLEHIERRAFENEDFRRVLYTAEHCQLVLMSLRAGEAIGEEVHDVDQFLRVEQGSGEAILNGVMHPISDGFAILVPAGTRHNLVNTGSNPMKLYTLYAPPHHRDGIVHATKADADGDTEKFDGKVSE